MMQMACFVAGFSFISNTVLSQQNNADGVSIFGTETPPHDAAMLDVKSSDKGMFIPRMTESQQQAINPLPGADGLQVFVNNGSNKRGLWFWDETLNGNTGDWVRYGIDIDKLMPPGVIIPFDLNTCPEGWLPFTAGVGRFMVGKGQDPSDNLITYPTGGQGGQAKVALQVSEIPDHGHDFSGAITGGQTSFETHAHYVYTRGSGTAVGKHRDAEFGKRNNKAETDPLSGNNTQQAFHSHSVSGNVTGALGVSTDLQGLPHENRPPFVPLIYCIRDF